MSSDRSFKMCGADEMDVARISSFRNQLSQLITQQLRSTGHGSALNIPEVDQLISKENATSDSTSQTVNISGWVVAKLHYGAHFVFLRKKHVPLTFEKILIRMRLHLFF